MCCRVLLAVMHYNENGRREQAQKKDGNLQWQISHPRGRQGEAVLKAVKRAQTFGWYIFIILIKENYYSILDHNWHLNTHRNTFLVVVSCKFSYNELYNPAQVPNC